VKGKVDENATFLSPNNTLCQRGRYYSYEERESNQRLINTNKNQRHVDRGAGPRRVQSGEVAPKGDTLFH
jgi:hypothetical protein